MRTEITIDIPDSDPTVAFDTDPDDGVCSLTFGDDDSLIRLVGSPDALSSLFDTLRDTLREARNWASERPQD